MVCKGQGPEAQGSTYCQELFPSLYNLAQGTQPVTWQVLHLTYMIALLQWQFSQRLVGTSLVRMKSLIQLETCWHSWASGCNQCKRRNNEAEMC